MWWIIIGIILAFITFNILKDTRIKVYCYGKFMKQYDFGLPVWVALIMMLISVIPVMNIAVFITFLIYYFIKTMPCDIYLMKDYVFSLNGDTWLTKILLLAKRVLNKKI